MYVHSCRAVVAILVHALSGTDRWTDRQTVSSAVPLSGCKRPMDKEEKSWCTACNKGFDSMTHKTELAKLSACHFALAVHAALCMLGSCLQNSSSSSSSSSSSNSNSLTPCLVQVVLFPRVQILNAQHLWNGFL